MNVKTLNFSPRLMLYFFTSASCCLKDTEVSWRSWMSFSRSLRAISSSIRMPICSCNSFSLSYRERGQGAVHITYGMMLFKISKPMCMHINIYIENHIFNMVEKNAATTYYIIIQLYNIIYIELNWNYIIWFKTKKSRSIS